MTKLELSIDPEGLPGWGVWEAVREFVQNWADNTEDSDWFWNDNYDGRGGYLYLSNKNTSLPRKSLLVGNSTKREDNTTRGRHGDGLKSAMAVLLRQGKEIRIHNDNVVWTPTLSHSDIYGCELLTIVEQEVDSTGHLEVFITMTCEDFETVIANCLLLQEDGRKLHSTDKGDILLDEEYKGKIFCGGIYVNTLQQLEYGYDFKPEVLSLDRDRQAIDSFDIKWITKEMWREIGTDPDKASDVAEMIHDEIEDTKYLVSHASPSTSLKEAAMEIYRDNYQGNMLAESFVEAEELKAAGNDNVVYLGKEDFTNLVKSSDKYKTIDFGIVQTVKTSPKEKVENWLEEWQDEITEEVYISLQDLINTL